MTKLRDGWNAKNDIGMVLERIAVNEFNPGVAYGADGEIYHSDSIIGGAFVEVMIRILRNKFGDDPNDQIDEFIKSSGHVLGKRVAEHPIECQELLEKFKSIYK